MAADPKFPKCTPEGYCGCTTDGSCIAAGTGNVCHDDGVCGCTDLSGCPIDTNFDNTHLVCEAP